MREFLVYSQFLHACTLHSCLTKNTAYVRSASFEVLHYHDQNGELGQGIFIASGSFGRYENRKLLLAAYFAGVLILQEKY